MPLPLGVVATEGKNTQPWWISQTDVPAISSTSSNGASLAYDLADNTYFAFTYGTGSLVVVKQNPRGVIIWAKSMPNISGASAQLIVGVAVDSSQNVYIGGYRATGNLGAYIYKLDINGNAVWSRHLTYSSTPSALDYINMTLDNSGNLILACRQAISSTQKGVEVLKINTSTGGIVWQTRYAHTNVSTQLNFQSNLITDNSGNIYLYSSYVDTTLAQRFGGIVKFNSNGIPLWHNRIENQASNQNTSESVIAVDSTGATYAMQKTPGSNWSMRVIKCNASGIFVWSNTVSGTTNWATNAMNAMCDSSNNLYLTAAWYNTSNSAYELLFSKYNSSTGSVVWQNTLNPAGIQSLQSKTPNAILDSTKSFFGACLLFANTNAAYAKVPLDGTGTGTYTQDGIGWLYQTRTITTGALSLTDASILQTYFTGNLLFSTISNPTITNFTAPIFTISLNV